MEYYSAVKKNYFWIECNLPDMMSKRQIQKNTYWMNLFYIKLKNRPI